MSIVDRGARRLFSALSRARGKRIFHPHGIGFEATLTVADTLFAQPGVPLLETPGAHPAIVRFSRATGVPEPLPDALGLSIRLLDLHGRGRHQDFLLVTSADAPVLHHLFLPAPGGFLGQTYSSVLPYRIGEQLRLVGAEVAPGGRSRAAATFVELDAAVSEGLRFRVGLAPLGGRLDEVATLDIGRRLDDGETERLEFNPWHTGGGIRPTGPFNRLRRSAYAGSQEARAKARSA